jgi:diguanylate cyclase (GGDEF)-like protein
MPLLAELQRSPLADAVRAHVQELLEAHEAEAQGHDVGTGLLRALLESWARRLPEDSADALEVRLLLVRLRQPPSAPEAAALQRRLHALAERMTSGGTAGRPPEPPPPPSPPPPPPAPEPEPAADPQAGMEPSASAAVEAPAAGVEPPAIGPSKAAGETAGPQPGEFDRRVDFTYRRALQEKRERIQKIQEALVGHISEVIKQNEKFGVLLEVEDETLRQTDRISELEGLKQALLSEVGRLRDGHQTLAKKLDTASKYLQIIGTEGQHLNEELTRVHILSLTDELTDLPNRRAFLRRLEDEVARVQRYGYPLSLALIDMDGFKGINDRYGHAAGDEVLRVFATGMLSIFRHHDMVARYGGEEFAVLLPNTDRNGAMRALEKVRKRTAESSFHSEGKTMPLPTFSAGISLYKPGETPGSLIERADKALYQAKRMGRDRIELAQLDGAETAGR